MAAFSTPGNASLSGCANGMRKRLSLFSPCCSLPVRPRRRSPARPISAVRSRWKHADPRARFRCRGQKLGLVERLNPRELIGLRKLRKIWWVSTNTNRLAWLQAAAPGSSWLRCARRKKAQIADADALLRMPCDRGKTSARARCCTDPAGQRHRRRLFRGCRDIPMRLSKCRAAGQHGGHHHPAGRATACWPNMPSP